VRLDRHVGIRLTKEPHTVIAPLIGSTSRGWGSI
jgi:hypothetical protein